MENEIQQPRKETIMSELRDWFKIETNIRENSLGGEILKDKDYLKMKLAEYDRIHYKYKDAGLGTKDEKAHMTVVGFQRKKMRKLLYPGLLSRIYQIAKVRLAYNISKKLNSKVEKQNNLENYAYSSINLTSTPKEYMSIPTVEHESQPKHHNIRPGQDLGRRKPYKGYRKGNGI